MMIRNAGAMPDPHASHTLICKLDGSRWTLVVDREKGRFRLYASPLEEDLPVLGAIAAPLLVADFPIAPAQAT